jgi:hypothetical protein
MKIGCGNSTLGCYACFIRTIQGKNGTLNQGKTTLHCK